jgi:hypothetical protein
VKLDLVPVPSVSDLPEDVRADARRATVLVALIAVREQVGGELCESVGYLLASAARGHAERAGEVETGLISGDLAGLAERVAVRVRR